MKLSDFQKKYKHHINKGLCFHNLGWFKKHYKVDFDVYLPTIGKNLQRGLVWTLLQKQSLIMSILKGTKIPVITMIQQNTDSKEQVFEIIDGKQRLTTLFDFLDDKFPIEVNHQKYFYSDLPEDCKREISHYNLTYDVHYSYKEDSISDQTKIVIFEEINFLGTPQDVEHLNRLKNGKKSN